MGCPSLAWRFGKCVISLTQSNSQYRYIGDNDRVGVYTPNGLNQYTHIANQPMDHDLNGNMINDGFSSYTFDDENRLLTASSAGLTAKLSYDPNGRLFQTVINGETREYLYDGDALVAEYVGGTMQRRYVHGDQVDEPWVQYEGSSVNAEGRRYLHANHQGSIIAHSNINGSVVNTLAYDAYGIPASMNVGTFAYTGQIYLKALNLYYYKARIYSPRIGRFLQKDPIGYKDQMNLYAYVGNDPVNMIDPNGMEGTCVNGDSCTAEGFKNNAAVGAAPNPRVIAVAIVVGVKALTKGEQLAKNAANGAKAEKAVAQELGDKVAGKQVTFKTNDGTTTRTDIVTKDKGVVEVKSGDAKLTQGQQKLQDDINAGREVTPVGKNAEAAGLEPGKPTTMTSCTVERRCN